MSKAGRFSPICGLAAINAALTVHLKFDNPESVLFSIGTSRFKWKVGQRYSMLSHGLECAILLSMF